MPLHLTTPSWIPVAGRLARAAVLGAAIGGLLVAGVSRWADTGRVKNIEVEGAFHVGDASVRHLAGIHQGEALLLLDLARVVEAVGRHPLVAEVSVSRSFPDTVVIEVTERRTAMLVASGGALYRADELGALFAKARGSDLDYPILTGLPDDIARDQGDLARRIVSDASKLLVAVRDSSVLDEADLSEIYLDRHLGFTLVLRNGSRIRAGWLPPETALGRLGAMVDNGLDLRGRYSIDLDLDGMAVVTPLS